MAEHPPESTADLRGSDDPEYATNLKRATLAASVGSRAGVLRLRPVLVGVGADLRQDLLPRPG